MKTWTLICLLEGPVAEEGPGLSVVRAAKPDDADYEPSINPGMLKMWTKRCLKADNSAMVPDGCQSDPPDDVKQNLEGDHVDLDLVRAFKKTRHCPACASGLQGLGATQSVKGQDLRLVMNMSGL